MNLRKLLPLSALVVLMLLLLTSCGAQPQLHSGLDLYDTSKAAPIEKMTESDLTDYLIFECGTDGFCKVIIYARNPQDPNGVERYFKSADVPDMASQAKPDGTAATMQETLTPGQPETVAAEPPEILSWAKRTLLGQWQIWILMALAAFASYALYNWTFKTTPKQAPYSFEDMATKRSTYTFGEDMTVYHIPSRNVDRANAFQHLTGRSFEEKLEEAERQIRSWLESAAQEIAGGSEPEDVDSRLRSWIGQVNTALKNVKWDEIDGTVLEGYPDCGRDLVRIRVDGFRPSEDMKNFLNKVKEASKHTEAIRLLMAELDITKKEAIAMYAEFNKTDAFRDVGNSAAAAVAAIVARLNGGTN